MSFLSKNKSTNTNKPKKSFDSEKVPLWTKLYNKIMYGQTGDFIKDSKSLALWDKQYKYYVPIERFISETVIATKYKGFLTTFKVENFDNDYMENYEINHQVDMFNSILSRIPEGFAIHFETQRRITPSREFLDRSNKPIPTQIINRERYNIINSGLVFFKTDLYVTISYIPPSERVSKLKALFDPNIKFEINKSKEEEYEKWFKQQLDTFESEVGIIMSRYAEQTIQCKRLTKQEMTNYLFQSINGLSKDGKLKEPPLDVRIDDYLVKIQPQNDEYVKLNGKYCQVITIKAYPDKFFCRAFESLEYLPFEFRMIHRYIPLGYDESIKLLKRTSKFWGMKLKDSSSIGKTMAGVKTEVNQKALEKKYQSEELANEVREGNFKLGLHTFNVIVEDSNLENLKKNVIDILKRIENAGFNAIVDSTNTLDTLAGCIPGNVADNLRKVTITSDNLVHMIPISSRMQGKKEHPYFKQENGEPEESLFIANSRGNLFDFNNHVQDVGHTMITGRTGSGKSALLNFISTNALKFDNTKCIFFDYGKSSFVPNILSGGIVYDLGVDNVAFQPLAHIDNPDDMSVAINFVLLLIELQDPALITPKTKNIVANALKTLSDNDVSDRTISNLITYIDKLEGEDIKLALEIYSRRGLYGRYLDNNYDSLTNTTSRFITFEMMKLSKDPKILQPIMFYLMTTIRNKFMDGKTKLFTFYDEAWVPLESPIMMEYIKENLKTERKFGACSIFATQSLDDIRNSEIGKVLASQCQTKIYLSNPQAETQDRAIYEEFNLNPKEIRTIANAVPKRQFFYKSSTEDGARAGSILFELDLTALELAYVGRTDISYASVIKTLKKNYGDNLLKLNVQWLNFLNKNDEKHGFAKPIMDYHIQRANYIIEKAKLN